MGNTKSGDMGDKVPSDSDEKTRMTPGASRRPLSENAFSSEPTSSKKEVKITPINSDGTVKARSPRRGTVIGRTEEHENGSISSTGTENEIEDSASEELEGRTPSERSGRGRIASKGTTEKGGISTTGTKNERTPSERTRIENISPERPVIGSTPLERSENERSSSEAKDKVTTSRKTSFRLPKDNQEKVLDVWSKEGKSTDSENEALKDDIEIASGPRSLTSIKSQISQTNASEVCPKGYSYVCVPQPVQQKTFCQDCGSEKRIQMRCIVPTPMDECLRYRRPPDPPVCPLTCHPMCFNCPPRIQFQNYVLNPTRSTVPPPCCRCECRPQATVPLPVAMSADVARSQDFSISQQSSSPITDPELRREFRTIGTQTESEIVVDDTLFKDEAK